MANKQAELEKLEIDDKSIRGLLVELSVYEDIFSNGLSGELKINDSTDIRSILPITGFNDLRVKWNVPGIKSRKFDKVFFNYNLTDVLVDTGIHKSQDNILRFCSESLVKSSQKLIFKTYKGKKISEIVEDILETIGIDEYEVEETVGLHDIVIPGWTAFYAINWLAARAEKSNQKPTTYLFFENVQGYKFLSLENMYTKYPSEFYGYFPQNTDFEDYEIPKESVITYDFFDHNDTLKSVKMGMWASKLNTIDLVRRKFDKVEFEYKKDFEKSEHVDGKQGKPFEPASESFSQKYDSFVKYTPTRKDHDKIQAITRREPNIKPDRVENWLLPRISKMQQARYYRIRLIVSGTLMVRAGDTITFELPLVNEARDNQKISNDYYKGKYLVTSIKHILNNNGYICIMEAIKDNVLKEFK